MSFYKRRNSWFRRRWLDFRQGHSIYLVFAMTFLNFVTIQYSLLVNRVPALGTIPVLGAIFTNFSVFAIVFVAAYMPLAIVIGFWHRRSQWKVEQEAMFNENVIQAKLYLFLINLIEGRASEKEREDMRKVLERIIKKVPEDPKTDSEVA